MQMIFNKKLTITNYYKMVEVVGIEPTSFKSLQIGSTCLFDLLGLTMPGETKRSCIASTLLNTA